MKTIACLTLVSLAAANTGCFIDVVHEDLTHDCYVGYDNVWSSLDLVLIHDDTRVCPLEYAYGEEFEASATVRDDGAVYPDADTNYLEATFYDGYSYNSWTGYFALNDVFVDYFNWELVGSAWKRRAYQDTEYFAEGTPDYLEYSVALWSSPYSALAAVELEHCEEICD